MPPRKRYAIKRRASREYNLEEKMIDVDPNTVDLSWITELYVMVHGDSRDPKHRWQRANGLDSLINTSIDPAVLLEAWQGLSDQLELTLGAQTGKSGEFANQLRGSLAHIPHIISLLAEGKVEAATKALEAFGYGIIQAGATAVTSLSRLEAEVAQQDKVFDTAVRLRSTEDERMELEADNVTSSLLDGQKAYKRLCEHEDMLDMLDSMLMPHAQAWHKIASGENTWIQEHLAWLGDQHDEQFCTQASRFCATPDETKAQAMVELINEAMVAISTIRSEVADAFKEHQDLSKQAESELNQLEDVGTLLAQIRQTREKLVVAVEHGFDNDAIALSKITQEQFDAWQALLVSPDWRDLNGVRIRLHEKTKIVRDWLRNIPDLRDEDEAVIKQAKRYIEKLQEVLAEFNVEVEIVPEANETETEVLLSADLDDDQDEPTTGSLVVAEPVTVAAPRTTEVNHDPSRFEEICEFVLAVAVYIYIGTPKRPTFMTPNSVLKILEQMGLTTREDRTLYFDKFQEWLDANSWDEDAEPNRFPRRTDAWLEISPDEASWILFRQGRNTSKARFRYWRLTNQMRDHALTMSSKHGITEQAVMGAYAVVKERRPAKR